VVALVREPPRRLITLTGPGGVGKTRLALAVAAEVAPEFADGAVFVPLAAIADADLLLPTIARALDIRETRERSWAEAVLTALRERYLLLVLDNVEHLALPGMTAAADVAALLDACPGVTALVTSRAPLHLRGEQRFVTPPLALPTPGETLPIETLADYGAIAFFVERARLVNYEFALNADNADAIAAICRRLDGLPLAIELATPWLRVLPPAALLAQLEPRLPLLQGGAADQPARLRTMRDAIAWSYDLLSPDEARLFRRLAVFTGGFTLEAATWVAAAGSSLPHPTTPTPRRPNSPSPQSPSSDAQLPLPLLAGLIDKGLLQPTPLETQDPRFSMLETVREFALERLAERDEVPLVARTHVSWVLAQVERAESHMLGPDERQWHTRLDEELGNLRTALAWSLAHDVATALRIGAALWAYWAWYQIGEGRRWLGAALARSPSIDGPARINALIVDGALATLEGDSARCLDSGQAALTLARTARNIDAEARAGWIVATGHLLAGDLQEAARAIDLALIRFDQTANPVSRAWAAYARSHHGAIAFLRGDTVGGLALYEEALERGRQVGSAGILLVMLSDFAGWLIDFGDPVRARDLLRESLALSTDAGGIWLGATPLISLALVDALTGDAEGAARKLGAVDAARALSGLAVPVQFQDRITRAEALARAALAEDAYTAAWADGHADPDAVVAATIASPGAAASGAEDLAAGFGLSPREREVLALLVMGRTDKEIAAALFVSRPTASKHVAAILNKFGVASRTAAVSVALRHGLH
jgi:non-specific serine/threonine protein kinase